MSEKAEIIELNPDAKLERRIAETKALTREAVAKWLAKHPQALGVNVSENGTPFPEREVLYPDRGRL